MLAPVGLDGAAAWAERLHRARLVVNLRLLRSGFVDTAPCSGVLGLRWGYIGPHGHATSIQVICLQNMS